MRFVLPSPVCSSGCGVGLPVSFGFRAAAAQMGRNNVALVASYWPLRSRSVKIPVVRGSCRRLSPSWLSCSERHGDRERLQASASVLSSLFRGARRSGEAAGE